MLLFLPFFKTKFNQSLHLAGYANSRNQCTTPSLPLPRYKRESEGPFLFFFHPPPHLPLPCSKCKSEGHTLTPNKPTTTPTSQRGQGRPVTRVDNNGQLLGVANELGLRCASLETQSMFIFILLPFFLTLLTFYLFRI
jgi:hypothetical protein